MELFLFRHSEWQRLYNCSGVVERLEALYPIEQRTHPILAWTAILLGAIYSILYVPCMFSIRKHLESPCYKFMFYIGLVDMAELWICAFFHGFLSLKGASFCSFPAQIYFAGALGMFFWICETTADLILAANRCIDLMWPKLAERLFKKNRAWCWIAATTVYGLYYFAFTTPGVFNPVYFAWFFNPFAGVREDPNGNFSNNANNAQDLFIAIASPSFYLGFFVALALQKKQIVTQSPSVLNRLQKMIFVQVAIISILNMLVCLLYVCMAHFPTPHFLIFTVHLCWLHIHGLPPVIYLTLNKTIRTDCLSFAKQMLTFSSGGSTIVAQVTPVVDLRNQNQ